ncbi:hypothetical protein SLS59_004785, partial [Nothophoma quercina]
AVVPAPPQSPLFVPEADQLVATAQLSHVLHIRAGKAEDEEKLVNGVDDGDDVGVADEANAG